PSLERRARMAEFWLQYLFVEGEDDATPWDPWQLTFPLFARSSLSLSVDKHAYVSLVLREETGDAFEVAWADLAHWHPHVLRGPELDASGRRVAARSPAHPHPGIPLLLLYRFAPIASEEDARLALPLLKGALDRVGGGSRTIRGGGSSPSAISAAPR